MASTSCIFSEDVWANWIDNGKTEVLEIIESFLENDADPGLSKLSVTQDLSRALYEIIWAATRGDLDAEHSIEFLKKIINLHNDMASQIVEVASLVDLETQNVDKSSKQRENLLALFRGLPLDKLYKERLDLDTLGDTGVVKNKKIFHTKQIKVRTKMYYKQQKFNLLREETEGYSKLITDLNQEFSDDMTPEIMIEVVRSIIGCFNLDPNRVLDLILEAFECRPQENEFFTELIKLFPCETSTISELIGFKLTNYLDDDPEAKGIYTVVALLIQAEILEISDVYGWLSPDDSVMIKAYHREEAEVKELVRKANVVSTKDKDTGGGGGKDDKKEKDKEEEEREERALRKLEMCNSNHKLRLMVALLEIGDWDHYTEISKRFPDYYTASCPPVAKALCGYIHGLIEPIYRKHSGLPSRLRGNIVTLMPNKRCMKPVSTYDEMCEQVFPIIITLGPHLSQDVGLMYKLLRISKVVLKQETLPGVTKGRFYYDFLTLLDETLLPSLSLLSANPCIAEEMWESIKQYPYQHRYKLYGRWKNESYLNHASMIREKTLLLKKAKYIMMRVTKDTVKPVSRSVGKLSHNNPGPIFEYIMKQVQIYDNLISPIVDSLKYLTSLSYDMLGYCLVETLTLNKERTANDAMAISPWLQSLSSFCGAAFKKFNIELGGVLQFVANQLKSQKSIDLLILKEIVQKMGGTDSMDHLTPDQLNAMCGGDILRREAGQYQQERNIKRSSFRLKDSLIEQNLAIPLLLLMAQQRSSVVYNQTESPHLKLVGKLYDQCQDTMVQFGSYLTQTMNIEELCAKMPDIGRLFSEFKLNADVAFFLSRPLYSHLLNSKYDELRKKDRGERKQTTEKKKQVYVEACEEVLSPLLDSIEPHYKEKVWEDMDPSFFLTFWTLTMSDLEVPSHVYAKEIKKITDQISLFKSTKDDPQLSTKKKKELDRLVALKEKLQDEEKRQKEHVDRVMARLEKEKQQWFASKVARSPKSDTVTAVLQLCLFPRCTFTALDAIYCAKFIKMLHVLKTPNFSTLIFYDRMFCDITYTVASCTEQEAHRYASFLAVTLETVMHWHSSKTIYDKECAKFPGFVTKFRVSKLESNDYVDYENYRHVVHKWHYKITKALVTCLESGNYIEIRNAIFILQGIITTFPAITNLSAVLEKRIEKVKLEERSGRNDLYVLANSYSGRLKAKKGQLLPESEFHRVRRNEPKPELKPEPKEKVSSNGSSKTEVVSEKASSGADTNGDVEESVETKSETTSKTKEAEKRKNDEVVEENHDVKKVKKDEEEPRKKDKRPKDDDVTSDMERDEREGSVTSVTSNGSVKAISETNEGVKKRKLDSGKTRTSSVDSPPEVEKKKIKVKANGKAEKVVKTRRPSKKEEEIVEVEPEVIEENEDIIEEKRVRTTTRRKRKT